MCELDAIRDRGILSSLAGFPFLLVFSFAWLTSALLRYLVPAEVAPWVYVFAGAPAAGIAIALEKRVGFVPPAKPDPLLPLALQLLLVQAVAFPAIILVWDATPAYVPAAFAAIVGAHFLPFQWFYRTRIYAVLGILVAVGPFVLVLLFREKALHLTGFFVAAALFTGALLVRRHAVATWRRIGKNSAPA